jgi:predicted protein tyrosine phosphatase
MQINNKEIQTISTNTIEAIISRNEIIQCIEQGVLDKENLVLISISEPIVDGYEDESLTDTQIQGFKDSLMVKFWDIEEDFGNYKIISDEIAKRIQDFIVKNIDNRFIIHCRAGQSRSAGVGKAVECLKFFGKGEEAKYNYLTSFNSEISAHSRYSPNLTVFDKIVKDYK